MPFLGSIDSNGESQFDRDLRAQEEAGSHNSDESSSIATNEYKGIGFSNKKNDDDYSNGSNQSDGDSESYASVCGLN